ncbi:MAG: hypothetical protein WBM70_03950 [Sulfurovum sp.]|uniref:hypothetical protein n=1 Tax=Sulfurovum sp. TaxID=1969726 RepID=UPI003C76C226
MSAIIKYIIFIIIFIALVFVFFFFTSLGNQQIYNTVGSSISKELGLSVKVESISLQEYPYLEADMIVEEKYNLKLKGYIADDHLDIDYRITSNCLQSNICTIDDEIDILGHMNGPLHNVHVTGEGKALDGNVSYVLTKHSDVFKDLKLVMHDINSSKLFTLLGETAVFKGKADANILFDHIGEKSKKGKIVYEVKNENISGLLVNLHSRIDVIDTNHTIAMDVTAAGLKLNITEGHYDQERKYAHAFYTLDIKDLGALEKLSKEKYAGPFYAMGEIEYNKHFIVKGLSKSLGGLLDFLYEENALKIDLENVPSQNIMERLSYTPILDTNLTGRMQYDFLTKTTKVKTELKNAKFLPSELLHTLSAKSGIDLTQEVFDNSHVDIVYKDDTLTGAIRFANSENHLRLRDAKINLTKKSIDTTIDLKTKKYKLAGKTYLASLDDAAQMQNAVQDTYLRFNGTFNTHYNVRLNGLFNDNWVNMDYALNTARFPSHICTIEDDVNISGHLNGPFSQLHISGKGKALNGTVTYDGTKVDDKVENLTLSMKNIHALKLSTLLGQTTFPHGRSDIEADFEYLGEKSKKGNLVYTFKKGTLSKLPFTMKAQINVDNAKQTFAADMTLANAKINISEGSRDADANLTTAFYVIDVKDLTEFEELLGFRYHGPLYAMGEATHTKHLKLQGVSKTFGGILDFVYEKDKLNIDLTEVSFKRFMTLFPHPILLDGDTTGKINYDFIQKRMIVKTNLKNAKFLPSDMVSTIYKKSQVNMLVEEFDYSTLEAIYQNDILRGDLKLESDNSSFYLTNTTLNTEKNTIDAYFDFKMQDQEFTGKVYGSVDDPKVNLNMQKLIRHKMDKQMDSMVGEGNRKMMEKMPMGEAAKDAASGVAGGFMGVFF